MLLGCARLLSPRISVSRTDQEHCLHTSLQRAKSINQSEPAMSPTCGKKPYRAFPLPKAIRTHGQRVVVRPVNLPVVGIMSAEMSSYEIQGCYMFHWNLPLAGRFSARTVARCASMLMEPLDAILDVRGVVVSWLANMEHICCAARLPLSLSRSVCWTIWDRSISRYLAQPYCRLWPRCFLSFCHY